jgi:hypothetical protein
LELDDYVLYEELVLHVFTPSDVPEHLPFLAGDDSTSVSWVTEDRCRELFEIDRREGFLTTLSSNLQEKGDPMAADIQTISGLLSIAPAKKWNLWFVEHGT